jgi:hypothetical protein
MPLSEHEERILAEIERRLSEDDPRFVERARRTSVTDRRGRRLKLAMAGFAVGFLLLLGLVVSQWVALTGMALMFASVVVGVRAVGEGDGTLSERALRVLRGDGEDDPDA